jgi:hypothetical protein
MRKAFSCQPPTIARVDSKMAAPRCNSGETVKTVEEAFWHWHTPINRGVNEQLKRGARVENPGALLESTLQISRCP